MVLAGADVLCGVVGNTIAQGGEGGDDQVVQLDGCGVTGHDGGAEAVDNALNDDVADGDEALLHDAGHRDDDQLLENGEGELLGLALHLDLMEPTHHHSHGQHAADALAQEGSPGHTGHAHLERGDKQDVHADVGHRGHRQEIERSFGIAQGGENAGSDVVEEYKRQAPDVDIQIQFGIRHQLCRGIDE